MTSTLILVPTELERVRLRAHVDTALELCGFGPIAAAVRTAELVARRRPERVVLVGIGGSYDLARAPIGSARCFARVFGEGVGVADGERFLGPRELRLPQLPELDGRPAVADELALWRPRGDGDARASEDAGALLTAPTASADAAAARARAARRPSAVCEDMEAFGAALACLRFGDVPLCVVRGVSNRAGDRDHAGWSIDAALAAAAERLDAVLTSPWFHDPEGPR